MREILFRGKRIDGQGWVEGQFLSYGDGAFIAQTGLTNNDGTVILAVAFEVNPETVGQLLFKLGGNAKAFEGDFAQFDLRHFDDFMPAVSGMKGIIHCNNGIITIGGYYLQHCTNIVLVDNIHDNPELLK